MLSAVLAVFLLVQPLLVPAGAAEPAVSEDFESYDVGAVYRDGPFSDSDLPAGAQVSKQVQAEQGGRFLRMSAANTAASDGTARVRMRTTKNFSDKFTVQWDYRTPDTSFAQLDIYLRQGGNVRARVTKKGTVDLLVLDAAKVAGKMESVYGTQPMKAGRWYTFKVQADEKQLVLEVYEKGADMALETHTIGQDATTLTKLFDPYAIWFDLWGRSDRTDTSAATVDLDEIYITEGHYQGLKKTEAADTSVVDGWDSLVLRSGGGSMKVDNLTLKTQSGGETVIRERFDTYSPGGVPAGWTVDNAPAAVAGEDGSKATLASAYGGLYASVLGDSISTYAGWSNDATRNSTTAGNLVSYPREDSGFDVNGTWWMQAVRGAGMELLVNNSYSGDELNPDEDPGIGLKRCMQLHDDRGRQPDVLLIYFGTNDAGAHKRHTDNLDLLRVNYARMMENIAATYPKAQVFYFTLLPRTEFDCLPYSALIRELVTGSGNPNFHLVDLQKDSGITLNNLKEHTVDNLHPNAKGMDAIAATVLKALEAAAGDKAAQGNGNTLELSADGQIRYKADVPSKGCELSVDVRFDRFGGSVGLYKGNRAMVSLRVAPGKNGTGMLQYFNGSWTDTGVTMEKGRWYNLCLEKSPRRATVNLWLDRTQVLSLDYATMADSHSCAAAAMTDVANDTWYHSAVDWVLANGVMSGFNSSSFVPYATLTRAQVVQVLYNREGQPDLNGAKHAFSDVPATQWYNNAVTWASARGVVSGYGGGIFKPDDPVSLEQVFVILWNYMGNPPLTGDADAVGPHSEWAGNAIGWSQASGVINGVPFQRVTDPANRAQTAQIMMELFAD